MSHHCLLHGLHHDTLLLLEALLDLTRKQPDLIFERGDTFANCNGDGVFLERGRVVHLSFANSVTKSTGWVIGRELLLNGVVLVDFVNKR